MGCVYIVYRYGWTALHYAAVEGQFDIVELLLACGVDVRARDKDGVTAAYRAQVAGYDDVICLMKSLAGVDDLLLVVEPVKDDDGTRQPPTEQQYANVRKFTTTQNAVGECISLLGTYFLLPLIQLRLLVFKHCLKTFLYVVEPILPVDTCFNLLCG